MAEIRNYLSSDFPQVREVLEKGNLYWDASDNAIALEKKVFQAPDTILVAVEDKRVVGTQIIVPDFFPFLFRLAVHPDYRNRGIGKSLMQKGEEVLRKRGFNHVNILVASNDKDLVATYERQGYEKGNQYIWMTKTFL